MSAYCCFLQFGPYFMCLCGRIAREVASEHRETFIPYLICLSPILVRNVVSQPQDGKAPTLKMIRLRFCSETRSRWEL